MGDSIKKLIARLKALYAELTERWGWLAHLLAMLERYNQRRGNLYASSIAFIGILSLVPILMVAFAIAGFVLASRPDLVQTIIDSVVEHIPGDLGDTLSDVIRSAIDSRATVGVIGLVSAALTGIGWMSLFRTALTEIWGGRAKRNAILSKVFDLLIFVGLGAVFLLIVALSVVANGPIAQWLIDNLTFLPGSLRGGLLSWGSRAVSLLAIWALLCYVYSRLPLHRVPVRAVAAPAAVVALVFVLLFTLGTSYLQSMFASPAAAAFGPVLGVMVFAYLASRIVLYGAAWAASNPANEAYQMVDEVEPPVEVEEPVLLSPVYENSPTARPRQLLAAIGLGAAVAGLVELFRRN